MRRVGVYARRSGGVNGGGKGEKEDGKEEGGWGAEGDDKEWTGLRVTYKICGGRGGGDTRVSS